jgi:MFS family permease
MSTQLSPSTNQQLRPFDWQLWLKWTFGTALAWAMGAIVSLIAILLFIPLFTIFFLFAFLGGLAVNSVISGALFGALVGVLLGPFQQFALKMRWERANQLKRATWMGSLLGAAIGGLITLTANLVNMPIADTTNAFTSNPLLKIAVMGASGAIYGAVLSFVQTRWVDREVHLPQNWMLYNFLGWAIGSAISSIISGLLMQDLVWTSEVFKYQGNHPEYFVLLAALCGLIGGSITGIPFARMLKEQKSEMNYELTSSDLR